MAATKEQRQAEIILNGTQVNSTLKQLTQAASVLNAQLRALPQGTKEFADKAKELATVRDNLARVNAEVRSYSQAQNTANGFLGKMGQIAQQAGSYILGMFAVGSISNFIQYLGQAIGLAGKISDQFADIQKTTGMSAKEVRGFAAELQKLDTRTSLPDLLNIAKIGGQIGIAKKELLGFVETVDKAVVALGGEFTGGAEQVAKELGILKGLFKETKNIEAGKALNDIGSAINALGDAGSATGPVIAEFTKRMGALPGSIAPSIQNTLGLGAAFEEMGLTAEISSGGLTNVFLTMGEKSALFAQQLGISKAEFDKMFNQDSNATVLKVAESFKGLSDTQLIETMKRLGIGTQESIKVMGVLSNSTDLVRQRQALANVEMAKGTSLTNEFNSKNNTLQGQMDKFGKEVSDTSLEIGNALAPALVWVIQLFSNLFSFLKNVVVGFFQTTYAVVALTTGLLAYNAVLIASTVATIYYTAVEKAKQALWVTGRALLVAYVVGVELYMLALGTLTGKISLATVAQRLFNLVIMANPVGLVIGLIGGLVAIMTSLAGSFQPVINIALSLWNVVSSVFGDAFKTIGSLLTLDIAGFFNGIKDSIINFGTNVAGVFKNISREIWRMFDSSSVAQAEALEKSKLNREQHEKEMSDLEKKWANQRAQREWERMFISKAERDKQDKETAKKFRDNIVNFTTYWGEYLGNKLGIEKGFWNQSSEEGNRANAERLNAQSAHAKEQEKKDKEAKDALLRAQQEYEDLKNATIQNQYDREIAQINTETNRKIEEVKKNGNLVTEQETLLELQRSQRIAEVNKKRIDDKQKADEEAFKQTVEQAKAFIEEEINLQLAANEQAFLRKTEQANLLFEQGKIKEAERQALIDEARFEREQADLETETAHLNAKLALLTLAGDAEGLEAQRIANKLLEIEQKKNDDLLKKSSEKNAKDLENQKKLSEGKIAIQQAEVDNAKGLLDLGLSFAQENSAAQKGLMAIQGVVAIADIIQKTQREIAGYYAAYSLIPGGQAISTGLALQAKIRAGIGIATIVAQTAKKFEDGGLLSGPSHAQGGIRGAGKFGHIEVEGGEFITNTRATANNLPTLQYINSNPNTIFDIVPRRSLFAEGGQLPTVRTAGQASASVAQGQASDMTALMAQKLDMLIQATLQNGADIRNIKLQISLLDLQKDLAEVEARQIETTSRG